MIRISMKIKELRKKYKKEEKRHDAKYEKENSLHEKRHITELDTALKIKEKGTSKNKK